MRDTYDAGASPIEIFRAWLGSLPKGRMSATGDGTADSSTDEKVWRDEGGKPPAEKAWLDEGGTEEVAWRDEYKPSDPPTTEKAWLDEGGGPPTD